MKNTSKFKFNPISVVLLTISVFLIFAVNACVRQEASKIEDTNIKNAANPVIDKSAENAQIAAAQNFIKKAPELPEGYNKLALAYIQQGRETGDFGINSKAETAVNRALELEPENPDAKRIKGSLLLTFHRFDEALEFGTQMQKIYPQDPIVYGILTDANIQLGNYKEAADDAQKMVDLKPNMESYIRVSSVRSVYGDSDGAIAAMSLAARVADPGNKEIQAWCLTTLGNEYFKVGRYQEAETQYDAALAVFPNYHYALTGKGNTRAAAGDYENAVKLFTQSQDRVPLTQTIIPLGDVYQKIGKPEEARKQYELAEFVEQKLGNIDQRTLALMWADHDTKLDEALQIAAAEHDKRKDIYTADIYAWTLYKKGQFEEAKKIIPEALRMKTKDARIFYHAGMIEKALGNKKAAADYLQKAIQLNPAFDFLQADVAKNALQEVQ